MKGIGATQFWGYSPSFSLLRKYECEKNELNVLIVGSGDGRHIFPTMKLDKNIKNVNFYIFEDKISLLCRISLFVSIYLNKKLSLEDKAKYFRSLHSDCLLSQSEIDFLSEEGSILFDLIIGRKSKNASHFEELKGCLDFSKLKYKEREEMEEFFKFWKVKKQLDVKTLRDVRQRAYFKDRFDNRENLYHLDYVLNVKKQVNNVKDREYIKWRKDGNFVNIMKEEEEGKTFGNITYASKTIGKFQGRSVEQMGFWNDIICGPFYSYGIQCVGEEEEKEEGEGEEETEGEKMEKKKFESAYMCCMENLKKILDRNESKFKVIFLRDADLGRLLQKSAYKKKFNIVFMDTNHSHFLDDERVNDIFVDDETSFIYAETVQHFLKITKELKGKYVEKLKEMGKSSNWTFVGQIFDGSVVHFRNEK